MDQAVAIAGCLDPDMLAAYVDGRLTDDQLGVADRHIDGCRSCRGELSALAIVRTPAATSSVELPEDRLGRYVVMRELGRGGMGVVVRAYDPELARAVAVKVLHEVDVDATQRLRSEAQAMARLAHPNVVTVYDVVAEGEVVFVAMELIEGETLRGFARHHTWREVLAAAIAAGGGLAASHAAELVHRDFKPENVLCGTTGRVAVSDFGLARRLDDHDHDTHAAGTPAYMAPEVYRGEPATPASDQFSFCATTYEVLYGQRAFEGTDLRSMREAILDGAVRDPPAKTRVPARVWRVLARGLARDPAARFASMTELLAALEADPAARRRRRIALAVALAAAVTSGALIMRAVRTDRPSCEITAGELASAWDPARRAMVDAAVHAAGGDVARIDAAFDGYAASWVTARRAACEATHVRGVESATVLEARNRCLDRARHELGALAELLVRADRTLAERAVEAVYKLRDPASCRGEDDPPAASPQRDELDRANVLYSTGREADADAIAAQVLLALPPAASPQLVAEALLIRGQIAGIKSHFDASVGLLFDGLAAAERARADRLVVQTWIAILAVAGPLQQKFELATMAARAATATMARIDVEPSLQGYYAMAYGTTLLAQGKIALAREQLTSALAIADADASRPGRAGVVRSSMCNLETEDRHWDVARKLCADALVQLEAAFGPDHFVFATSLNTAGVIELADRRWDAAERLLAHARAIFERSGHTDHLTYALVLSNLGAVWVGRGDVARAIPMFERARDLFATRYPDHPQRANPLLELANAAYTRNDVPTAIRFFEEARTVNEANLAKDSPQLIDTLYNLSNAYASHHELDRAGALIDEIIDRATAAGRLAVVGRALEGKAALADQRDQVDVAIALRRRALVAFDRQDDPYQRAWTEQLLGDSYLTKSDPTSALEPLEHSLAYFDRTAPGSYEAAGTRFSLAQALWAAKRDRTRALALAHQADAELAKMTVRNSAEVRAAVQRWLKDPSR